MALPSSTRVDQADRRQARPGPRWPYVVLALLALLALLLVIGLAVGWLSFDVTGGDVQVEAPSVDADVNAPDVDIEGGNLPDVDVDGGSLPDVDVQPTR